VRKLLRAPGFSSLRKSSLSFTSLPGLEICKAKRRAHDPPLTAAHPPFPPLFARTCFLSLPGARWFFDPCPFFSPWARSQSLVSPTPRSLPRCHCSHPSRGYFGSGGVVAFPVNPHPLKGERCVFSPKMCFCTIGHKIAPDIYLSGIRPQEKPMTSLDECPCEFR